MNDNLKKYLPSRKVVSFVILPLFFLILFFVIGSAIENKTKNQSEAEKRLKENIEFSLREKDSDGDGLLDWQERLYKTDERNPDTDGDGSPDGNEVSAGTDPLDKFNTIKKESDILKVEDKSVVRYQSDPSLSLTDKVARDLFVKTVDLKQNNLNKNEGAINYMADEIFNQNDIFSLSFKEIKKSDLKISNNTSKSQFKNYLFATLNKYSNGKEKNELILAYNMIVQNDTASRGELEDILTKNINLQKDLLKIKVPNDDKLINLYIDYLNSFNLIADFVKNALSYKEDPLKSLAFLQSFDKIREISYLRSKKLLNYLNI